MQGGRRGRDNFFDFGDPFAGFPGFGGFGGQQNLLSSVFGGRDPFDDPFFTRPFGGHGPFGSMFESGFFGSGGRPFPEAPPAGFLEHQDPQPNKRRGPIIEEIDSDDEKAEDEGTKGKKDNPRKHSRVDKEPYIEDPDDAAAGRKSKQVQYRNDGNMVNYARSQPQSHSFTFQSSSVAYGGADGAYYTQSMTRRSGSDGVKFEEHKEADSTTGQANHRISRGLHEKGHTLARKLNSDGRVDKMETLHNLNEDELVGFEEAWKGSSGKHLPGWKDRLQGSEGAGSSGRQSQGGGWALPSTQRPQQSVATMSNGTANSQHTGRRAADAGGSRGRTRG